MHRLTDDACRMLLCRSWLIFQRFSNTVLDIIDIGEGVATVDYKTAEHTIAALKAGELLKFYELNTRKPQGQASVASLVKITDAATLDKARHIEDIINRPPYNAGLLPFSASQMELWRVTFTRALPAGAANYNLVQWEGRASNGAIVRNSYFHDGCKIVFLPVCSRLFAGIQAVVACRLQARQSLATRLHVLKVASA